MFLHSKKIIVRAAVTDLLWFEHKKKLHVKKDKMQIH